MVSAHPEGRTGAQVYRGVAGLFIVDDPSTESGLLPNRYGVDDIPLIIQDRRFTAGGQLDEEGTRFSPIGPLGDEILVNGTHDPFLEVTSTLVRIRVLNASNARTFNLGFSDSRPFSLVATDAGLLPTPVEHSRLLISPSERVEIVVAVGPGDGVTLRSFPNGLGAGSLPRRFAGGDDSFDLLRVRAAARLAPSPQLPERLPAPALIDSAPGNAVRTFDFNHASRINGRPYDPGRVDFTSLPAPRRSGSSATAPTTSTCSMSTV